MLWDIKTLPLYFKRLSWDCHSISTDCHKAVFIFQECHETSRDIQSIARDCHEAVFLFQETVIRLSFYFKRLSWGCLCISRMSWDIKRLSFYFKRLSWGCHSVSRDCHETVFLFQQTVIRLFIYFKNVMRHLETVILFQETGMRLSFYFKNVVRHLETVFLFQETVMSWDCHCH